MGGAVVLTAARRRVFVAQAIALLALGVAQGMTASGVPACPPVCTTAILAD